MCGTLHPACLPRLGHVWEPTCLSPLTYYPWKNKNNNVRHGRLRGKAIHILVHPSRFLALAQLAPQCTVSCLTRPPRLHFRWRSWCQPPVNVVGSGSMLSSSTAKCALDRQAIGGRARGLSERNTWWVPCGVAGNWKGTWLSDVREGLFQRAGGRNVSARFAAR